MDGIRVVQDVVLVAFVLTVVYTDWRWRRIPNAVTYPTMAGGLVLAAVESAVGPVGFPGEILRGGLLDHIAGLVGAFLISYPFFVLGGLKAGDGKLLMAVGALRGTSFLLAAALWGAMLGGVIAIVFIVARRVAARAGGERTTMRGLLHSWIPYGVALGLGALVALAGEFSRLS